MDSDLRVFNVRRVMESLAELLNGRDDFAGRRFSVDVASGVPAFLRGDPERIRRASERLVGNAIEFNAAGDIVLEVHRAAISDSVPGVATIHISARRSGLGMPEGGIAQHRDATNAMDADKAMVWTVAIALEVASDVQDHHEVDSGQKGSGGVRILLAEDYEANQRLMKAYFQQTPYDLEIASNGELAVDKAMSGSFDLILMDVHMPVMDGYAATRKIRAWEAQEGRRATPILALTADDTSDAATMCKQAGCDGYLTKPIDEAVLLRAVREHAAKRVALPSNVSAGIAKLIPRYLAGRRADVRLLRDALLRKDYEAIRTLGHNMKGSGTGYGFPEITEIGKKVEAAAKSNSTHDIEEQLVLLSALVEPAEL